jgi:hypothetical protein
MARPILANSSSWLKNQQVEVTFFKPDKDKKGLGSLLAKKDA